MEEEEGGGVLKKKNTIGTGEVDFKEKSGTAWSHNFLNQKPWHPLSYPNQRRKWIAEQTDAQRQRRAEEVAREFAQEQDFYRQTALVTKKEKEKVEIMKAVSFMYVRPPGYNAESAKAAEIEDERRRLEGPSLVSTDSVAAASSMPPPEDKKKSRPKDVFGRALPTEEEFDVLKNAPRLETGLPARPKPFGIEIRNVKCLRCGNFGHQSGDRECLLKDTITSNEESRLKRDDPLTSIMALADTGETLKWELKQKPGMSPPRGGFDPDDPNQQIVAEDIFDEYGGFLNAGGIPDLLANFRVKKSKKHSKSTTKRKGQSSDALNDPEVHESELSPLHSDSGVEKSSKKRKMKESQKKRRHRPSSDHSDFRRHHQRTESSSDDSEAGKHHKRSKHRGSVRGDDLEDDRHRKRNNHRNYPPSNNAEKDKSRERNKQPSFDSPDDVYYSRHHKCKKHGSSASPDNSHKGNKRRGSISPDDSYYDRHSRRKKHHHSSSSDDLNSDRRYKMDRYCPSASHSDSDSGVHHKRNKHRVSASTDGFEYDRHKKRNRENNSRRRHRHHSDRRDAR